MWKCCTKFRRQSVGVSVPSESVLQYVVNGQILKDRFLVKEVTVNATRFVTCSVQQYVVMRLIQ
jgi:ribosomal protein L18E